MSITTLKLRTDKASYKTLDQLHDLLAGTPAYFTNTGSMIIIDLDEIKNQLLEDENSYPYKELKNSLEISGFNIDKLFSSDISYLELWH